MRNYLLAAVAAAALTSPAMARDKSTYVGVSGGVMLVEDTNLDFSYDNDPEIRDAVTIDHNLGFDVDLTAGYDFGLVRAEAELGYKRASVDEVQLDTDFVPSTNPTEPYDANGKVSVLSIMGNILFDFGDEDGWSGFLGAGLGWARVKYNVSIPVFQRQGDVGFSDSDGTIAWQILAGIRKSISPNLDLGLKYRFFNASKLNFEDDFLGGYSGRFRSHSLLLTLAYNFYTPEAPPPPPATQTCPDGSVILATDACPPPPPPPPPPEPERG